MTTMVPTPRDRLQRLLDYGVRASRYWWVVAACFVFGGFLTIVYTLKRPAQYQSAATLMYEEMIQANVLQGRDQQVQRDAGSQYRELLLSRSQLAKVVEDPDLGGVEPDQEDAAIDDLRTAITFEAHGTKVFRIGYTDADPDRAYAVTQKLTDLLIEKEQELRNDSANATVKFAQQTLDDATQKLLASEQERAQFLVAHPEFAEDAVAGSSEGAAVRKSQDDASKQSTPSSGGGNPRVSALERQRIRIKARLDAADNPAPPTPTTHTPSADEQSAQRRLDSAEDAARAAQKTLDDLRAKGYQDSWPAVRTAKDQLADAQQKVESARTELAAAKAGVDIVEVKPPASAEERAALQKQLADVEAQIAAERARPADDGGKKATPPPANDIADTVVKLETEWARLRREVEEQSTRVQTLNDSVFRAQLDAQTRMANEGAGLQVLDAPFLPKKPSGKSKRLLVLAGLVLFTTLGCGVALGLAVVDDRIYRSVDIEHLEVAPVLAVIPRPPRKQRKAEAQRMKAKKEKAAA